MTDRTESPAENCDPAVGAAVDQMRSRAGRIHSREVETALRKLDGLDDRERAEIERLGKRLVECLLAVPERSLVAASDEETVATALELFGDGDRESERRSRSERRDAVGAGQS